MLIDLLTFDEYIRAQRSVRARAFASVVDLLQKQLGVTVGYNKRIFPYEDSALVEPARLAARLIDAGVIVSAGESTGFPDEPPYYKWSAICNVPSHHATGGASFTSAEQAFMAALAEGLERYIWMTQSDYFIAPVRETEAGMRKRGPYIAPHEWAGFTHEQRRSEKKRQLREDARYLWVRAHSLVSEKPIYIPAQIITGKDGARPDRAGALEPIIRYPTTNGLATWTTTEGARLRGIAELLEREAYMIMWLNQLTLPRIDLAHLASTDPPFARTLKQCERYRLKVHAIKMLSDAPIYPICVVLEDESDIAPRFAHGLKAHRSLARAVEGATLEALRARRGARLYRAAGNVWDTDTASENIGHRDRLYYWSVPEHAEHLRFLVEGPIEKTTAAWDEDDERAHYRRLIEWCKTTGIECVSVSLGASKKNPTSLAIEMIAMPQIIPTYLAEKHQLFGGERIASIPMKFGYTARAKPYADRPHPYS